MNGHASEAFQKSHYEIIMSDNAWIFSFMYTTYFCHLYQLRQGSRLHLGHHPGTVIVDSSMADIKLSRYNFV